jgi:4-hydroxybenzoate polyprenyltransferase
MLRALIKTMRPRQWTKNAFVLAPLVFDRQLFNWHSLFQTLSAVILFCLLSSVVYIFNDLLDVEADRKHPTKKNRPIASGKLPVRVAIWAIIVFLAFLIPSSIWVAPEFALIALIYLGINLAYTKWLKFIPLVDVFTLAAGFVLRVGAGVVSIHVVQFSPWLFVVMTFGALFIGFGKRRAELATLASHANTTRKVLDGYTLPFLDQLIMIVTTGTVVSYSLYTFLAPISTSNHNLMLTIPFVLYGMFRYLYLVQVENIGSAPEEVLLTDRPLQIAIVLWGLAILVIFYFLPIA